MVRYQQMPKIIEMIKFFFKNGADVHVRSEDGGMSALEIASHKLFSNDALFKLFEKNAV